MRTAAAALAGAALVALAAPAAAAMPRAQEPPPASFRVTHEGPAPAGGAAAVEHAAGIWAQRISSPVPIDVTVQWLGGSGFAAAQAGSAEVDPPGAPVPDVWYPATLADRFAGSDRTPSVPEISMVVASEGWYVGIDGRPPPGQADLVTVALHEIAHGLGFGGSMEVDEAGAGSWGFGTPYPWIYDTFATTGDATALLSLPNGSTALGDALTSGDVRFAGASAAAANGGAALRLFAPDPWLPGSSYGHLDQQVHPGTLMGYADPAGFVRHDPDPVVLGVLADLGWPLRAPPPPPPPPPPPAGGGGAAVRVLGGRAAVTDATLAAVGSATGTSPVRLSGPDRYATAASIVADVFPATAPVVYVATGASFPDALAGSAAAAVDGAPVVLVTVEGVPAPSAEQLRRLAPAEVRALGGRGAIPDAVLGEIARITGRVPRRLAGPDRFATAAAIVAAAFPDAEHTVYVATGASFPDALAGSAAAAAVGSPVLLVDRDSVPGPAADQLQRLRPRLVKVLGGRGAVSDATVSRIAELTGAEVRRLSGPDRYATAAAIVADAFPSPVDAIVVATGEAFPDALAGSAAAARLAAPVLLVRPDAVPGPIDAQLRRLAA